MKCFSSGSCLENFPILKAHTEKIPRLHPASNVIPEIDQKPNKAYITRVL